MQVSRSESVRLAADRLSSESHSTIRGLSYGSRPDTSMPSPCRRRVACARLFLALAYDGFVEIKSLKPATHSSYVFKGPRPVFGPGPASWISACCTVNINRRSSVAMRSYSVTSVIWGSLGKVSSTWTTWEGSNSGSWIFSLVCHLGQPLTSIAQS